MKKELCFILDDKKLYLEKVLVEYEGVPIFFLCKEAERFYIALCTDVEELSYVVTRISTYDIHELLHGEIAMRNVILKQNEFWSVQSGDNVMNDVVNKMEMSQIDKTALPKENACYKALTPDTKKYVAEFDRYIKEKTRYVVFEKELIDKLVAYLSSCVDTSAVQKNVEQSIKYKNEEVCAKTTISLSDTDVMVEADEWDDFGFCCAAA